jgi:glycosyltransferase involved in cell wall biosynthesis
MEIDYFKLSILVHLKDLIDKVEYFTFDPIYYNPIYLETSLKKIKRKLLGINAYEIIEEIIKIREIIKDEYGLNSNEGPRFILSILTPINLKIDDINKFCIIFKVNRENLKNKIHLDNPVFNPLKAKVQASLEMECKDLPLTPIITQDKIFIRHFKPMYGNLSEVEDFIYEIRNIKERIVIPIACFLKNYDEFDYLSKIVSKINLFNYDEILSLTKYAIRTNRNILLLNQLPRSNIPSRYEKLSFALQKYQKVSVTKFSLNSKRPIKLLFGGEYKAIIAGDVVEFALGFLISRLKRVPNFNDVRDPYLDFFTRSIMINKLLLRFFINKARKIFYAAKYLVYEYRIDYKKAVYLPNGAFLEWYEENINKERTKIFDLCYIGGYNSNLIKIFNIIKCFRNEGYNTTLLILGINEKEQKNIKKVLHDLNITDLVTLLPPMPHSELKRYLSLSKVGLSLKAIGGGGKEFDYAVMGLPTIRIVKKGREGDNLPWVIKVGEDNLKEAIKDLLQNGDLYKKLSENAILSIFNFFNLEKLSRILVKEIFENE